MAFDPTMFVDVPKGTEPPIGAPDMDAGELNKIGLGVKAAHDDLSAHAAAADPHGDRAYADGIRSRTTHTGTQSADTLTDGVTNKAFTAVERTKLAGVATAATANASDAQLRDRSTHTGTQAAGTITGLAAVATSGSASDLSAGTVAITRLPTGISGTTVALGDHTHGGGGGAATAILFSGDNTGATNVSATLVTQAGTAATAGVPLIVPPGNYLISATASLPAGLTMWAPSGARFFGVVAAAGLLSVGGNTVITGVTLENTSEPDGCSATIQAAAENIVFERCKLIAPSIGVHANQSGIKNLTVRNCRIQDTYFGVLTNTGANDIQGVLVEGCHFTNILGDAIEFNHPSGSAPTCRGFRVVGNNIAGANTTGGTTSTGFGVGVAGCADVTITGNTIHGVLREGIHVEDGSHNIEITGNTVRQIPASGTNRGGICVYGVGTDDVTITGNTVTDINGIGIEVVYAGGSDLVANVVINSNIIRGCTGHGVDVGADGTAGEGYSVNNNVIRDCDYGVVLRGNFRWGTVQGNMIDGCNAGVGAGQHGAIRFVRDNVITNWVDNDYDGFGPYGGSVHLTDRTVLRSQTATGTTMTFSLFRLGQRAEGTVAIALTGDGSRKIDSLWRLRWTGTALQTSRVDAGNATADDTALSVVNGVLSVALSGVANGVVMSGTGIFRGALVEDSATLTGTVTSTALT